MEVASWLKTTKFWWRCYGRGFHSTAASAKSQTFTVYSKLNLSYISVVGELNRTIVILLLIYVAGALCSMLRAWMFVIAGQRLVARLRKNLFSNVINQEIAFFDVTR